VTARTVVVALYHDEKPLTLAADLHTEELVVHLGPTPIVLELNGFRVQWDTLTPVGSGSFALHNHGVPVFVYVSTVDMTTGDIRDIHHLTPDQT
jgi:hypothetical protein